MVGLMGTRTPAAKIPAIGREVTADQIYGVLQWLRSIPLLDGRIVEFTTDGTGSPQLVPHGLGRAYRGAFVVGSGNIALQIVVGTPENTNDNGGDATKNVRVDPDAASTTRVRLWVFASLVALLPAWGAGMVLT